jgi:hypothetical protein
LFPPLFTLDSSLSWAGHIAKQTRSCQKLGLCEHTTMMAKVECGYVKQRMGRLISTIYYSAISSLTSLLCRSCLFTIAFPLKFPTCFFDTCHERVFPSSYPDNYKMKPPPIPYYQVHFHHECHEGVLGPHASRSVRAS